MVKCCITGACELIVLVNIRSASVSASMPTANAPSVRPPLQTMFQLLPVDFAQLAVAISVIPAASPLVVMLVRMKFFLPADQYS